LIREFLLGQKAHDVLHARVVWNLIAPRPNVAATLANVRRWPPALGLTRSLHRSPSVPRCSPAVARDRLLRRYLPTCGHKRTIGRDRTAAGCRPVRGDGGGGVAR